MATMRRARFRAEAGTFEVEETEVPEPGRGQVLVKVEACGICMSDVHLIQGVLPALAPEVTPGHEVAGIVAGAGEEVPDHWKPGTRVTVSPGQACGMCRSCQRGNGADFCAEMRVMGSIYDGGWAEYVVVGCDQLIEIPEGIGFEQAAILVDAVTTPYAALLDTGRLRPAEAVGIWGIGGLGTHAIQIARLAGANPIVAVDNAPVPRQRALDLGADLALDPEDPSLGDQIMTLTSGRGLDLAADFVGVNAVRAQAVASLGPGGRAVLIGLTPEPITIPDAIGFAVQRKTMIGHFGGTTGHIEALLKLVALGRLDVSRSITGRVALSDIHIGIRRLEDPAEGHVRIVVTPEA